MGRFGGHRSPHYDPREQAPVLFTGPVVSCWVISRPKSSAMKQQVASGIRDSVGRELSKIGQDGFSLFHDVWGASQQGLKTGDT